MGRQLGVSDRHQMDRPLTTRNLFWFGGLSFSICKMGVIMRIQENVCTAHGMVFIFLTLCEKQPGKGILPFLNLASLGKPECFSVLQFPPLEKQGT